MNPRHSIQKFLSDAIEAYELVREYGHRKIGKRWDGDEKLRDQVLEFIPYAAANNFLFCAQHQGRIVGLSIAGPTNKPGNVHCFHEDGKILFVLYVLIHPQWRFLRKTRECLRQMMIPAYTSFPACEALAYYRHEGKTYQEVPLGGERWPFPTSSTPAAPARRSSVEAETEP